ncbi:MAG: alpha-amylase, partial [Dehalococcoidia bacterium]
EITAPTISVTGEGKDLYRPGEKPVLETALLGYIRQRRWFSGKARYIRSSEIEDVIAVPYDSSTAHLILIRIDYAEGEPETYLIPVTLAWGEEAGQVIDELPQAVIAHLKHRGNDSDGRGIIYDALVNPDFRDALLNLMARRRIFKGEKGEVVAWRTRKVFHRIYGLTQEPYESRLLKGEQTNTSVVYGDKLNLKLFRRLEEGVSPEFEIGRFLTEVEPFPNAPPVAGVIEYHARWREPVTLGVLHSYIHNEGDAWKYTLDSLGRYFEAVLAHPGVEAPIPSGHSLLDIADESVPSIIADTVGHYLVSMQLLGQRTAEFHLTLASAVDDHNFVPDPFSIAYQRSLFHSMRGSAIHVLQLWSQRMGFLPDEAKA